jgi:hypothetical protein
MPIQFPSSPTVNQEYTYEGKVWAWDGSAWVGVRQVTGVQKSNIWAKQSLLIPKRGFGLNSGYNATTDQRRTKAGTIPMLKHNMERNLGLFQDTVGGIVTSGLVLNLDAGNAGSYPGTGTAWTDLSGNGNNGTLKNSPTYSSTNGGELILNGTNQYADCGNAASLQITSGTIGAWIKADTTNSGYNGIVIKQYAWGLFVSNNVLIAFDWGNGANRTTGVNVGNNTWNNVAMSFTETSGTPSNNIIVYVNGSAVLTATVKHVNQSKQFIIGNGGPLESQNFGGSISQVTVYNRVLSATEITQNYEVVKDRYGL